MILPGHEALKMLEGVASAEEQEQPAGVDLTAWKVLSFVSKGSLLRSSRALPEYREVEPEGGFWRLGPGAYRLVFGEVVNVPEDCAAFCFPRSTLLRMGATLECAVWDPGYRGRGSSLLLVFNEHGVELEVGARVAQLVFVKLSSKPRKLYSGAYQHENL